jgi:molybdopterin converting factor small subunit
MATVTAHYHATLRDEVGICEETVEATTVRDLLRHIKSKHGSGAYKAAKAALIVVNGRGVHLEKAYATPLAEGDVVGFYPLGAGG